MKVAVVGGRNFSDFELLNQVLSKINSNKTITLIVSGGAKGADSFANAWAEAMKIPTMIFLPDWDKFGKSAGYKRNHQIIMEAECCVAFWDGESKGTKSSIDLAKSKNMPLKIIMYKND